MTGPPQVAVGEVARDLIAKMLEQHEVGIRAILGRYDRASAVAAWHEVLRGVEEFLNVLWFGVLRGLDRDWLLACPLSGKILSDSDRMPRIEEIVGRAHDHGVVHRFRRTVVHLAEADRVFRERGIRPTGLPNGIDTIGAGEIYLQSRRRHFVSLFYAMAGACTGVDRLEVVLAFPTLACVVEHSCATITGLHQRRLLL